MSRISAGEALPPDRFKRSGGARHAPVDDTIRADGREATANVAIDCVGRQHDKEDVELAGQALDEKYRVFIAELDFGSLHFEFCYLDLIQRAKERNIAVSDQIDEIVEQQREEDLSVVDHESGGLVLHAALLRELLQIFALLESVMYARDRDLEGICIDCVEFEACEKLASA
jgi:hypothetical protein